MRKLILGIVVVMCLDIGFVAYRSADLHEDMASKEVNAPGAESVPVKNAVSNSPADGITAGDTNTQSANIATDRFRLTKRNSQVGRFTINQRAYTAKLHFRPSKRERVSPARTYSPFTTIVYVVPRPTVFNLDKEFAVKEPIYRKPNVSYRVARNAPRPEDKPFIARLLPIIKKPYGWIRAIGSKLN